MSEGKLAAQVAHACIGLRDNYNDIEWNGRIVVLKSSDIQFQDACNQLYAKDIPYYIQEDWGLTEIEEGTETTVAFYEE